MLTIIFLSWTEGVITSNSTYANGWVRLFQVRLMISRTYMQKSVIYSCNFLMRKINIMKIKLKIIFRIGVLKFPNSPEINKMFKKHNI